ncbi:MAG: glucose 1-dehydrogenase [Alphaproteobacteria bacterium]|nr:glucose 1-dehydrogenase [Alphaproteobacteria bacterium]
MTTLGTDQTALFKLSGAVALVTGASSGLGSHFATTLARAGARVALAARRTDRLAALAAAIGAAGGTAVPVALDVADAPAIAPAIEVVERALGPVEILINNAGIAIDKPVLEVTEADWDAVIDTNLKGGFLVAQAVARRMVATATAGRIVNIASILGATASQRVQAYAASKAGLIQITRTLAVELARHGIRVNAIAPGYVETEFNRDFLAAASDRLTRRVPLRRLGRPEDLDGVLLLLASDASAYMTGAVVTVDGGMSLSAL